MKLIWQTAFAAYRLSLQTGSDDGYYPGPDYKFAHGSKRERKAINRALDIIKAPEDKLKNRAPGFILVKQHNRKRERASQWGPPTLFQYNCRCAVVRLDELVTGALSFGKAEDGPRTMHGLVAPEASESSTLVVDPKMSEVQRRSYELEMAEHRKRHDELLAGPPGRRYVWVRRQDASSMHRPIHKPGGADETPKVEE
jgi:hypothetical protein